MGVQSILGIPISIITSLEKNKEFYSVMLYIFFFTCKVLGLGNARGRLYTRHAGLPRYPADSADKEWIASHNLVNAVGGKTYIMVCFMMK